MKNPNREVMSNLPPFLLMQPRPQGLTPVSPVCAHMFSQFPLAISPRL